MRTRSDLKSYEAARDRMCTGDVVAFGGKGRISGLIKLVTRSKVSHVGIVLRGDFGSGFGDSVMLAESTTLIDLPDELTGRFVKGVQLHWLSKRLASYQGEAWWYPLAQPLSSVQEDLLKDWVRRTHDEEVPYDTVQALGAGVDFWDSLGLANDPDFSRLFCSELCARALQVAGRLPADVNPSEETPAGLVSRGIFGPAEKLK